ncbi:MAG: PDC sensor domain-containing protein [Ignavibacteriae bacterium]|nr:PDC sensor domain-containing protein [Ignavibacteriota bacterium]
MKNKKLHLIEILLLIILFSTHNFSQETPESVINLTKTKLINWASSNKIISSINDQNAKNLSLDKIKDLDKKWTSTSGLDDFMNQILNNDCSQFLKNLRKENSFIVEAFVMDNKGANVAMTNKTSDYWQGDEDKFIKSFNNGNGKIHYGKVTFDESTQTYLIQVSVPVLENNKTIGVVTFGIDYGKFK